MNEKILPSEQIPPALYETLDHLWINQPYKFRLCPTNKISSQTASMHKDIEFNLVTAGELEVWLNGKRRIYKKGEFFFVNQYVAHMYNCIGDDTKYTHMIIKTEFLLKNGIDISGLWFQELIVDPKIGEHLSAIEEEFMARQPYVRSAIQGIILQLMCYLLRNYSSEKKEEPHMIMSTYGQDFEYAKKAIDYISENATKSLTVEEVSGAAGLSKYYFIRVFKKVTGQTLTEYINKVRCDCAKTLLVSGEYSITEAALSSGFNNVSYFAKIFKKNTGRLPSDYLPQDAKKN